MPFVAIFSRFRIPKIEKLYCHYNKLVELPKLPDSLERLYCSYNNLESLPKLPDNLKILVCFSNKLVELPKLPDSLEILHCYNKLIYNIFDLEEIRKLQLIESRKKKLISLWKY